MVCKSPESPQKELFCGIPSLCYERTGQFRHRLGRRSTNTVGFMGCLPRHQSERRGDFKPRLGRTSWPPSLRPRPQSHLVCVSRARRNSHKIVYFFFVLRGFGGTDGTAKCTPLLFCMKGTRQNPPHLVSRRMLERTFGGTAECWFPTFKCFRLLAVPPNPTPEEAEPVPGSWAQTGVSGFNFNLCAPSPCTTEGVFPSWWP